MSDWEAEIEPVAIEIQRYAMELSSNPQVIVQALLQVAAHQAVAAGFSCPSVVGELVEAYEASHRAILARAGGEVN